MTPVCFRCGCSAKELSRVSIKWNTYRGSGSCTAYLCNNCVDVMEPKVKEIANELTLNLNKEGVK